MCNAPSRCHPAVDSFDIHVARASTGRKTMESRGIDPMEEKASAETPEDVATLYSWANLHGAKYRDFSASRAQTRERARQRVQEAIETEKRRGREEADAKMLADAKAAEEVAILAEDTRMQQEADTVIGLR